MIWIVLVVLAVVVIGLMVWLSSEPPMPPPDPEHLRRAAVELHRIRRQRQASELRHQSHRDAVRVKRDIAEALDDERR
ncbi:MAG: hypothetical protein JSS68_11660 [Actinobacteria bacterium]|nr:hypothetical protein [Actinomycetota bacterium]